MKNTKEIQFRSKTEMTPSESPKEALGQKSEPTVPAVEPEKKPRRRRSDDVPLASYIAARSALAQAIHGTEDTGARALLAKWDRTLRSRMKKWAVITYSE